MNAIFLGLALAGIAQAAELTLEPVATTAKGYPAPTLDTPIALSVLRAPEIDRAARVPGDALRGLPGVASSPDGAWGTNPVIRGLKKEQIAVLVDGIRLNATQPNGAIASFVDLDAVERIEVVRHPVSVLYGSGGMAGAVNFITQPLLFSPEGRLDAGLSTTVSSAYRGARAAASAAYSGKSQAVSVGASRLKFGDYLGPHGRVARTGFSQYAMSAKYKLRLNDRGHAEISAQHHRDDEVWYPGSRKYSGVAAVGDVTMRSPGQIRDLLALSVSQGFDAAGAPVLQARVYAQDVRRNICVFSERLGRDYIRSKAGFLTVGGRLQADLSPSDVHKLSAGFESWRTGADPERLKNNPANSLTLVRDDPFERGRIFSAGVFAQDDVRLGQWSLRLGARFDRIVGDADQVGTGASATTAGLRSVDEMPSWAAGAAWRLSERFTPYASLASGFRSGDMRERFESSARGDGYYYLGNPGIQPENNTSLELGVKGAGPLRYSAAVYGSRIRDYIAGHPTGAVNSGLPVRATENIDRVDMAGVELAVERDLPGEHAVYILASAQRAYNKEYDEPMVEIPPVEASLGLRRRPPEGLGYSARLRMVGRQGRVGTRFSNGTENDTAGFCAADLGLGYRFGKVRLLESAEVLVAASNLFNADYHEHLAVGLSGREISAPGTDVSVSLRLEF